MNPEYTHIHFVLDRSGSMSTIRKDVVGGLNRFIEDQQKGKGKCTFSLTQFDTANPADVLRDFVPIAEVPPIGEEYSPRGGTPLYDAVGCAIISLGDKLRAMPEKDRPGKVVFATYTDGEENASASYSRERIAHMTREQEEKYGWHFLYLGANQDAYQVGQSIGTQAMSSVSYTDNNALAAMAMTSGKLRSFRATGQVADLNYTAQDRADLTAE